MKIIRKILLFAFICILMIAFFTGCSSSDSSDKVKSKYEYGTFTGSIEDKFELISGTEGKNAISGNLKTVVVSFAQTSEGGWVAWKDNNYAYTSEEEMGSLCSSFAIHFEYIQPVKSSNF